MTTHPPATKEALEPKLTMTADELFALHPLPWTHHFLLIKDANGRQVIHTGGLYNDRGRLHEGSYLSGLNALLVELVNSRVSAPIAPVVDQQCIKCGHSSDWLKHGELTTNGKPTCGHGRSYNDPCGCKCEFSTPLIVPCRCSAAPEIKWQFPDDHCPEGFWEARCPNCPEGKYYGFTRTAVIERWNNEQIGVEPYPFGRIRKQGDYVAPRACVKCKHFGETDPRGRCISTYYDAGGSLCYCGCTCEFVSSSQAEDLVDEVQHRMDQVVEAAVEWRQAGQAGGEWIEAAEKLEAAIESLLELRGNPNEYDPIRPAPASTVAPQQSKHHKHCSSWTVNTSGERQPCDCVCECTHSMFQHIRPGEHYWYEDCAVDGCPCMKFTAPASPAALKCAACGHESLFSEEGKTACKKPVRTKAAKGKSTAETHADDFTACGCKCSFSPAALRDEADTEGQE